MKTTLLKVVPTAAPLVLLLMLPQLAWSQAIDPFGGGKDSGSPTTRLEKYDPDALTPPVVLTLRESNPKTPEELTRAAKLMLDYGDPVEAKKYIVQLLNTDPKPSELALLQKKFSSALFLRMFRDERIAPEGRKLGSAVLKAAYDLAHDTKQLREAADRLSDSSSDVRELAGRDLLKAGEDAVTPLISILSDPKRAAHHTLARNILYRLGDQAISPLIGALGSSDQALRIQIIEILGQLRAQHAIIFLFRPYLSQQSSAKLRLAAEKSLLQIVGRTPTRYDAQQLLLRRAQALLSGALPNPQNYENIIVLWHWDTRQKTSVPRRYQPHEASLEAARRVATELYKLAPKKHQHRSLYLTTLLESEKHRIGLDHPLPKGKGTAYAAAAEVGAEAIEGLLSQLLQSNHIAAAAGAIELLGDLGNQELLQSENGQPRPLALALQHGDRRVRFAAVEAILKINPKTTFAGASRLPATLGFFINTLGLPRALVCHPQGKKARNLAGILNDVGFESDSAQTGRQAFLLAVASGDYDFVLISDATDHPSAKIFIESLRRDTRTNQLPVGLMARAGNIENAQRLAQTDPLVISFAQPHDVAGVSVEVQRVLKLIGPHRVLYQERIRQASVALDRMAFLLQNNDLYPFYDIYAQQQAVELALQIPQLNGKSAKVLGLFATPLAQRALVNFASQNERLLSQRKAAASAFDFAVKRQGLLLARNEILDQYDRFNKSALLDVETQTVLGALLDSIEAPTKIAQD